MPEPTPPPPVPVPGTKDPELGELLQMMHVVDVERQKRDLALQELSTEEQKKRLREELQKVYAAEGAQVSPAEIDAAIEAHYADRFVFKPPPRNLAYRLARLYTGRVWIFTRIVLPIMVLQIILAILIGTALVNVRSRHRAEQKAVQRKVEQFYQSAHKVHTDLELAKTKRSTEAKGGGTIKGDEAQARLERGADRLHLVDGFLDKYCPKGDASHGVTPDNYSDVIKQLPAENNLLDEARQETAAAEAILASIAELKAAQAEAGRIVGELSQLARETAVIDQAGQVLMQISNAVKGGDLPRTRREMAQLRDLRANVESAYVLRIVDRPGVKTGVARTPNGSHQMTYYYLLVEAVAPDNQVLSRRIVNEETQQAETLTMWAERVPGQLYQRVKQEKQQSGHIESTTLVSKERGYVTEKPGRLEKRVGQITAW